MFFFFLLIYIYLLISSLMKKPLLPSLNDIAKQTRLQQLVSKQLNKYENN